MMFVFVLGVNQAIGLLFVGVGRGINPAPSVHAHSQKKTQREEGRTVFSEEVQEDGRPRRQDFQTGGLTPFSQWRSDQIAGLGQHDGVLRVNLHRRFPPWSRPLPREFRRPGSSGVCPLGEALGRSPSHTADTSRHWRSAAWSVKRVGSDARRAGASLDEMELDGPGRAGRRGRDAHIAVNGILA